MKNNLLGKIMGKSPLTLVWPDEIYSEVSGEVLANPDLYVGLELEVEGLPRALLGKPFNGFTYEHDGSLRNNGAEYITAPTRTKHLRNLLTGFYTAFKINEGNYSERCSTHVHMNVCDMTLEKLATFVLTYQVFEKVLFNYVGNDRDKNIFCVPWCQANVNVNLVDLITSGKWLQLRDWNKYTALNLLPIAQRGTVEFRHMYGTCDVDKLMEWVNLIACMRNFANTPLEKVKSVILDLNTSSAYDIFLQSVFGQFSKVIMVGDYKVCMEAGVIDAKLMLTKPTGLIKEDVKSLDDVLLEGLFNREFPNGLPRGVRLAQPVRLGNNRDTNRVIFNDLVAVGNQVEVALERPQEQRNQFNPVDNLDF